MSITAYHNQLKLFFYDLKSLFLAVQTYKYQLTHSYLQLAAEMRSRKWLCCAEMPPVSTDLFVVVFFFFNLPHIIYIHILTLLCKILGSIASKSSPSSGGSYSLTLPGCSCPLNKVTLLTWKNKKKTLRATFLWAVLLTPAGRPYPRSANFHLPSSTSDVTSTLASSSFQSTTGSHHQAFLEGSALTSFEVKFAACLSSLHHIIFKWFNTVRQ